MSMIEVYSEEGLSPELYLLYFYFAAACIIIAILEKSLNKIVEDIKK